MAFDRIWHAHLLHKLNSYGISIAFTLVDVPQNWLNWFHFLFLEGGLLVMTFRSLFLDIKRMPMSTISFLTQLDPGILYLQNAFL